MHILVTGGTGFIGEVLLPALHSAGHEVTVLSRAAGAGSCGESTVINNLDQCPNGVDAVINLAGASLAGKRWNAKYKQEIVDSRIDGTRALGEFFTRRGEHPGVWLNASAIGYYGPRGAEPVDEGTQAGEGFSATLCVDWETAARDAAGRDTRLCLMRLGVVLDRNGGAYEQMAQPFRMGIANWIGSGEQYLSWIHRADVVNAMLLLLGDESLHGAFNLTAAVPVTSRELCDAMRRVHRTFVAMPMPATVMRAMVGEMADELLITGQRVLPKALEAAGFEFRHDSIDRALSAIEDHA